MCVEGFETSAKSFKKSSSTAGATVDAMLPTPLSSTGCAGTGSGGANTSAAAAAIGSSALPNVSKNAASSSFPANNPLKFELF